MALNLSCLKYDCPSITRDKSPYRLPLQQRAHYLPLQPYHSPTLSQAIRANLTLPSFNTYWFFCSSFPCPFVKCKIYFFISSLKATIFLSMVTTSCPVPIFIRTVVQTAGAPPISPHPDQFSAHWPGLTASSGCWTCFAHTWGRLESAGGGWPQLPTHAVLNCWLPRVADWSNLRAAGGGGGAVTTEPVLCRFPGYPSWVQWNLAWFMYLLLLVAFPSVSFPFVSQTTGS